MKRKNLILAVVCSMLAVMVLSGCLITFAQAEAKYNLETMTRDELTALQEAVAAEIKNNHQTNSTEEEKISALVKREVESHFSKQGIEISWAWLNYQYTKDWHLYSLTTHIDYKDTQNKKQKPDVYAETYDVGDSYLLIYLKIGEEQIIDNRSSLPSDHKMPLAGTKALAIATAVPVKSIKVTAGDLIKAYDNNEVKADVKYKGKMLTVTGKVSNISVMLGQTSVEIGTGKDFEWGITCYFDKDQIDKIAMLDKNDKITVTGKCDGKSFISVTLNNCVIVK